MRTLEQLQQLFPNACEKTWHQHPNGGGWVQNTAFVADTAYVGPNALVYDNANVHHDVFIFDNARVYGRAQIYEDVQVWGNARVYEDAKVYGDARVYGSARVYGDARVYGSARVFDNALVYENAELCGTAVINNTAKVYGNAKISYTSPMDAEEIFFLDRPNYHSYINYVKSKNFPINLVEEELENRKLGDTVRQTEHAKIKFYDRWRCSDQNLFSKWEQALEHELDRNPDCENSPFPLRERIYVTSDGKEFIHDYNYWPDRYNDALEHQKELDDYEFCTKIADYIYEAYSLETPKEVAKALYSQMDDFRLYLKDK